MIETNIRIVYPGQNLYLLTHTATVHGTDLTPDLLQRACTSLRYKGIAAIPHPERLDMLLIASAKRIDPIRITETDWALEVHSTDESPQRLNLSADSHAESVRELIERRLHAQLATQTDLWTLDSPAIWYESSPFYSDDKITAYRRYEISSVIIEKEGVGIVVDIGTAFFSTHTLAYFFEENLSKQEQEIRQSQFRKLTQRQTNQKGTLLYSIGNLRMKCYFADAPVGITCSTTGEFRVGGQTFASLSKYYETKYPNCPISPDGRAVRASFVTSSSDRPVWVAAETLRVRVMNDDLPQDLRTLDKFDTQQRRNLIQQFWDKQGKSPFGYGLPGTLSQFWKPKPERVYQFPLPPLYFKDGATLAAPLEYTPVAFRQNYHERLKFLAEKGCFHVPAAMPRFIHFAYPENLEETAIKHFAEDITQQLTLYTKKQIQVASIIPYSRVEQAVRQLAERSAEIVIFIMDSNPLTYHEAAFRNPWRIKRITQETFQKHSRHLNLRTSNNGYRTGQRDNRKWQNFVTMNALAVLQLLDVVPYGLCRIGDYEGQLAIDVGHDRKHFIVSLLIAREDKNNKVECRLTTEFQIKPDNQHDTINPMMLRDLIVQVCETVLEGSSMPLNSLLGLRDGEFRVLTNGSHKFVETEGVKLAIAELVSRGFLVPQAAVDLADFRKDSNKSIRFWNIEQEVVSNPLEGTAIRLNPKTIVLSTTGDATLTQGTSQPVVITASEPCSDIVKVAKSVFGASQLNWSSPKVAQRDPITIRSADDELQARDAQEIKKIR